MDSKETIVTQKKQPSQSHHRILSPEEFHKKTGLDFCFLMDITYSMDRYVEATSKSLQELIKQLQGIFAKMVKIAFLGYRDFESENPGEEQFEYLDLETYDYSTIESSTLYKFITGIKCSGGGDGAEDIRGAIKKAIEVMSWGGRMKYLILVADAPTHGKKYNNGISDNYPDEELEDALELLIKNDIRLVVLQVTKSTSKMIEEMKKFYSVRHMDEYCEVNELNAGSVEEMTKLLTSCLTQTIMNNVGKVTIKR